METLKTILKKKRNSVLYSCRTGTDKSNISSAHCFYFLENWKISSILLWVWMLKETAGTTLLSPSQSFQTGKGSGLWMNMNRLSPVLLLLPLCSSPHWLPSGPPLPLTWSHPACQVQCRWGIFYSIHASWPGFEALNIPGGKGAM